MEDIIRSINNAERSAAQIKDGALEKAARIAAEAEAEVSRILKESERSGKIYRETAIREAEVKAQESYNAEIEKKRAECREYCDGIIAKSGKVSNEIIRRVIRGGC